MLARRPRVGRLAVTNCAIAARPGRPVGMRLRLVAPRLRPYAPPRPLGHLEFEPRHGVNPL
jgi:hypothetical protein